MKLLSKILCAAGLTVFLEVLNYSAFSHAEKRTGKACPFPDLQCNMSQLMIQNNFSDYVSWTVDQDNVWQISVTGCRLDLIDHEGARKIIRETAPHGLAIIGDSLSRYQYLNLVYFLEHGKWHADAHRPNEVEKSFDSWFEFYRVTNERLRGHELCDCHRDNTKDTTIENRYYAHEAVKVSYVQLFGEDYPVFMHDPVLLNHSSPCLKTGCMQRLCEPGYCHPSIPPIIHLGSILQTGTIFRLMDRHRKYSQVFINAGLWWIQDGQNQFANRHATLLLEEMAQFHQVFPGVKVHWKTTTASKLQDAQDYSPELDFARKLVESEAFVSFFDAWALTTKVVRQHPELLWDNLHFFTPVYKGLNLVLLAYLASLP